ncbi:MAG: Rab family GTPase [Candidatus Hodarchaeota archaeon]
MTILDSHRSLLKICLVGDGGVGKTAILQRFLGAGFRNTYQLTIGAEIAVHSMVIDDQTIKFQIWDLAGQSRFEFVRPIFYKGSHAVIMVFDRTRQDTLINLWSWRKEVLTNVGHEIPIILLGNKSDLEDKSRIDKETVLNFIKEFRRQFSISEIPFFNTSAQSGLNITESFETIGRIALRYNSVGRYQNIIATQRIESI